ncbi:MAG TPA: hypothetical protein VGC77_16950 [Rhodopseudomonas sp.]|uniref:hypothetical protein n=1 Tax=Rhodopseudomonas sp. TaxID=1078 RepID=UPI002EDB7967
MTSINRAARWLAAAAGDLQSMVAGVNCLDGDARWLALPQRWRQTIKMPSAEAVIVVGINQFGGIST